MKNNKYEQNRTVEYTQGGSCEYFAAQSQILPPVQIPKKRDSEQYKYIGVMNRLYSRSDLLHNPKT